MAPDNTCVISGIGLVCSLGNSLDDVVDRVAQRRAAIGSRPLFTDGVPVEPLCTVDDDAIPHRMTKRQLKKLDRFTILAIAAAQDCLEAGRLRVADGKPERIGLFIGNEFGGWRYVEEQISGLYQGDLEAVNPYVATAWFPAAPQGEISILLSIGGTSKTFSAGAVSAGCALDQGLHLVAEGVLEQAVVGGCEAPLSALVLNSATEMESGGDASGRAAYPPGEGAAMLLVERAASATARNAQIHARIDAVALAGSVDRSMAAVLAETQVRPDAVDLVILSRACGGAIDAEELQAVQDLFGTGLAERVISTKPLYGNATAANMALDLAIGCGFLGRTSPIQEERGQREGGKPIRRVLVNGVDTAGQAVTVLISRWEHT
jgi:3-oxoacyl-[acyl-carrier-protein] synthase II